MLDLMFFFIITKIPLLNVLWTSIVLFLLHLDSITSTETLDVPKNPGQTALNICLTFGPGDLPQQKTRI